MPGFRFLDAEPIHPDWVIIGAPDGDGVVLYASDELTAGELRRVINGSFNSTPRIQMGGRVTSFQSHVDATVRMPRYQEFHATTYAEALIALFASTWQPAAAPIPELPPGSPPASAAGGA